MEQVNVNCIIVTYNGMQWIGKCLQSLAASSFAVQTIVIDNGSADDTTLFIKQYYPNIELIEIGKNLGFGQANNIGLSLALRNKGDHILLLNQDAYIETDTIETLVKAQIAYPQFGIISPIHLNATGNDFDTNFYKYLIDSDIKELIISTLLHKNNILQIIPTGFVNAAAWLMSRECLQKTGGFDPIFFHYGEDDNYARRALFKGFKIGILTTTKIYHDRLEVIDTANSYHLKKDRIIFLNQALDPKQTSYTTLIVKRFLRYSFLMIINLGLLNKKGFQYNFGMMKYIAGSFSAVKKSRIVAMNNNTPYLETTTGNA